MRIPTPPGALDEATRSYLERAVRGEAVTAEGILVPLARPHSLLGLLAGLTLCAAGWPVLASAGAGLDPWLAVLITGGLVLAGIALVAANARTLWVQRWSRSYIADALLVDPRHVWILRAHRVEALAHDEARPLRLRRCTSLGRPTGAALELGGPAGTRTIRLPDVSLAEQVWTRLQHIARLRLRPAGRRYLDRLAHGIPPPTAHPAPLVTQGRVVTLAVLLTGALLWILLPRAASGMAEARSWARTQGTGDRVEAARSYVASFPRGPHAAAARTLLDDEWFTRESERRCVRGLRAYLADRGNTRHRAEAERRIAALFGQVQQRLDASALASDSPDFAWVLSNLVTSARNSTTTEVPVVVEHAGVPAPRTDRTRRLEWRSVSTFAAGSAALRRRVDLEGRGAVIEPPGGVFRPATFRAWDAQALSRVNAAITALLGADVLDFVPASPGSAALTLSYRVFPTGRLSACGPGPQGAALRIVAAGSDDRADRLVREYAVRWRLAMPVDDEGGTYELTALTRPSPELRYEPASGDPPWAVSAVVIASAMANLETALGGSDLVGGPRPQVSFRFADIGASD
jgi:hypothetical protein